MTTKSEIRKIYRVRLDPMEVNDHLDVSVSVDERDLPQGHPVYIPTLFIEPVIHSLSFLFKVKDEDIDIIQEKLEAGITVDVELNALYTELIQARFVQRYA